MKPKLLVFASGTKTGGGSGFENLVLASRDGRLGADIVAVVSNHENGGVRERADRLEIFYQHFSAPFTADKYQALVRDTGADYVALSGWLKLVEGLDPRTTFNIHPGLLVDGPGEFGGHGMYGHHVHEAAIRAYQEGRITHSGLSMHFVTKEVDGGPVFFRCHVPIDTEDTPEILAHRVNVNEHTYQPFITNLVVSGLISWDGKDPASLQLPEGYRIDRYSA